MLTDQQNAVLNSLFAQIDAKTLKLFFRDTPELEKRMKNLRKWIPETETILLFYDYTLFGAGKKTRKVVRVAYQEFNRQMIVDEHNKPVSGYAYDYIQAIGIYAGWEVKFVPCSSFFGGHTFFPRRSFHFCRFLF